MYKVFVVAIVSLGNVLKELVEPSGAVIHTKAFKLGDPTISTLELWGAEYQESNALLVRPEHCNVLEKICKREKVDVCFVGSVTGKCTYYKLHEIFSGWTVRTLHFNISGRLTITLQ